MWTLIFSVKLSYNAKWAEIPFSKRLITSSSRDLQENETCSSQNMPKIKPLQGLIHMLHPTSEGQFLGSDKLLKLNLAAAHEAKGRIHCSRTIHLPLIKAPHGVSVVEVHPARIIVEAYTQALRHGEHTVARVTGGGCSCCGNRGG